MFKIGEYVRYKSEGVCVISDICDQSFGALGTSEKYYILSPVRDMSSVLYVPISNKTLIDKIQRLLSSDEIRELANALRDERFEWIAESRARNTAFKNIVASGDRNSLIILVNTIREKIDLSSEEGKKCTAGDENVFSRAKKMLLEEFSVTSDIKSEEDLMILLQGDPTFVKKI